MPLPKLFAVLSYADAPAALDWLQAIGFGVVRRQDGDNEQVVHAEVRWGDAVLMIASNDADYQPPPPLVGSSTGSGLYLFVDDVDETYRRALAAGAATVFSPEQTEWGTTRARVLDPQGREWSFGSYEPGASW